MKLKPKTKLIGGILLAIVCIYSAIALWPRPQNYSLDNPMRTTSDLPILIAHGGGNREFPDNTLEAFYNAYSVDRNVMMETDVSITKDGVVILSHDTTLDRKTNVSGAIADWNYSDLIEQKVDFGYDNPTDENDALSGERSYFTDDNGERKAPTDVNYPEGITARDDEIFFATMLEELLLAFPENRVNVEIKQPGEMGLRCLAEVLKILERHDAYDRVVLASFHEEMYDEYLRLKVSGEVPETFMFSPAYDAATEFYILQLLGLDLFFDDPMCVFQLPMEEYGIPLATHGMRKAAGRHNMAVHYWTINDPEEMRTLIDLEVDGIMTDYPHRLAEVYDHFHAGEEP